MAYVQPMVMVYQEYATTSTSTNTASLIPCIIGPCYHIVDATEDAELADVGEFYGYTRKEKYLNEQEQQAERVLPSSFVSVSIPNLVDGAELDSSSVTLVFKNPRVELIPSLTYVANKTKDNILGLQSKINTNLQIGDIICIRNQYSSREYYITKFDYDNKYIYLHKSIEDVTNLASYTVSAWRKVEQFSKSIPNTLIENNKFTFSSGTHAVDGFGDCTIMYAKCAMSYRALRKDLSSIHTLYSVDEINGVLGKISPDNPLAFAVNVCMTNTTTSVKCIGISSNDLEGYTDAKDRLENSEDIYSIVPLTTDPGILSMFKQHCVAMSAPEESRWRICIGSTDLQTRDQSCSGFGKISSTEVIDTTHTKCTFTVDSNVSEEEKRMYNNMGKTISDDVAFVSSGINPGDEITLLVNNTEVKFTVNEVLAEDIVTFIATTAPEVTTSVYFSISHILDKTEQANAVSKVSSSYGSSRFVNVWPNKCTIDGTAGLPGYYLACAVAGGVGGLPSHYGFTNLSMSGITAIQNSNDYFNREQLNIIAGGGTFIFVQDNPSAVPYVRHQLTTDRSAIEFQELSFVKNFDYVSYMCKDVLSNYIGKWNIVDETLVAIRLALCSVLDTLKLSIQAKIGAPVVDYKITKLAQLENTKDRLEVYVDVKFPYPLNIIGLHIVSQ